MLCESNGELQRLFIAIDVSQSIKNELYRIQSYYKPRLAFRGSYSPIENAHITLSFLGNISPLAILEIDAALKTIQCSSMIAKLGAINIFSNRNQISVLYITIICPELHNLVKEINKRLSPICQVEQREFVAHITLARISMVKDQLQFLRTMKLCIPQEISFPINAFFLKRSEQTIDRSVYSNIAEYQLR